MERRQTANELVALTSASATIYSQVMGKPMAPTDVAQMNAILHEVALAISSIVSIYGARIDEEVPKPLPAQVLPDGIFARGASVLRTPSGVEYHHLCMRRSEVREAIAILQRAGAKFSERGGD